MTERIQINPEESDDYIYLLHQEPFKVRNIPIYKIGKTTRLDKRFNEYPNGCIIYRVWRVRNCHHTEKEIIRLFTEIFNNVKECGIEYFSGKMSHMINVIDIIMDKINEKVDDDTIADRLQNTYGDTHEIRLAEINDISGVIPTNVRDILDNARNKKVRKLPVKEHVQKSTKLVIKKPVNEVPKQVRGKYVCENCNKAFQRQGHLDYHIENDSCKVLNYFCKYCDKGFTTDSSMYRHMKHICKKRKDQIEDEKDKDDMYEIIQNLQRDMTKLKADNEYFQKNICYNIEEEIISEEDINIDADIEEIECELNAVNSTNENIKRKIAPRNGKHRKNIK